MPRGKPVLQQALNHYTAFTLLGNVSELGLDTNERIVTSKKDEKMEEMCPLAEFSSRIDPFWQNGHRIVVLEVL